MAWRTDNSIRLDSRADVTATRGKWLGPVEVGVSNYTNAGSISVSGEWNMNSKPEALQPVKERPRPIVDEVNQTVFLPDEGKDRPACRVHVIPGSNLALKRLMEVTDKDFTKALLAPVLMSCRGCSKSFPGVARLTEMLMHLDSKLHSKTCGVPAEKNPLYQIALETTAAKKRAAEEEVLMDAA